MATTSIEWTDVTWNPIRGCSVISPGCVNCYAMKQAHRLSGKGKPYEGLTKQTSAGPQWTGKVTLAENHLFDPLKWRASKRVFVNSMSDLFHESVPDQQIVDIFGIMALAHWHTYQILTKRPERMLSFLQAGDHGILDQFRQIQQGGGIGPKTMFRALDLKRRDKVPWQWPLPNVWLGVSVENQRFADERIPLLLHTPAAVRFVSAEPLLGPVEIEPYVSRNVLGVNDAGRGIDWVIVGGESGPRARPNYTEWIAEIVRQCSFAGVACFVKQLGANGYQLPGGYPLRDRKGGDIAEWPEDLRVRQFPEVRP